MPHGFFAQAGVSGAMITEATPFLQKFSDHLRCQFRERYIPQAGEDMLKSFSQYYPSGGNQGQTFNYGNGSNTSGSLRDEYDSPEDLWEDNQDWYEDEDEAWDDWYDD